MKYDLWHHEIPKRSLLSVPPLQPTCTSWAVSYFSQQTNMRTLGRMPKGIWKEMFKKLLPYILISIHYCLIQTHTHARKHSNTFSFSAQVSGYRQPTCPRCLSACQLQMKKSIAPRPHPGKSTSMTPATWPLSLYLTAPFTQAGTKLVSSLLFSTTRPRNIKLSFPLCSAAFRNYIL